MVNIKKYILILTSTSPTYGVTLEPVVVRTYDLSPGLPSCNKTTDRHEFTFPILMINWRFARIRNPNLFGILCKVLVTLLKQHDVIWQTDSHTNRTLQFWLIYLKEDVTQMYEELQGFFNPMLGFGMGGEENDGGSESGFGFTDGKSVITKKYLALTLRGTPPQLHFISDDSLFHTGLLVSK